MKGWDADVRVKGLDMPLLFGCFAFQNLGPLNMLGVPIKGLL